MASENPKTVAFLKTITKAELEMILTDYVVDSNPALYAGYRDDAARYVRNNFGPTRKQLLLSAQVHGLVPYAWEEKVGSRPKLWSNS